MGVCVVLAFVSVLCRVQFEVFFEWEDLCFFV